jgi:hypothetical protein
VEATSFEARAVTGESFMHRWKVGLAPTKPAYRKRRRRALAAERKARRRDPAVVAGIVGDNLGCDSIGLSGAGLPGTRIPRFGRHRHGRHVYARPTGAHA